MGNREALLQGATQCLFEKGFSRTTSRDIATAAGVSLAAIGYHFGSTEALLTQALFQAVAEWGERLGRAMAAGDDPAAIWDGVIASVRTDRAMWAVQYELVGQIDRADQLGQFLTDSQRFARKELAELAGAADDEQRRLLGGLYQAILGGLVMQWLVDPHNAPTGADIVAALKLAANR
ncbi:TetR family transcriptional regulator [Catellatospora sp. TT07R-123]|uniref:TetR/AcrR family transcriptional regulator n=1 Tax=Catellatospora sp. TT07R-123 TaxID=2733863 RepID=UPI001B28429C|nr:TetR/AcrR family transcriptional regulator [Catellatospora sp. TT07R-123]GHJ43454.1 TetR family transcriptional regulator [Catellatospora sp. TT07R-123]